MTLPKPYYQDAHCTIYNGDCRTVMQTMPDNSVDAIVTDPPYGLSFMGKTWDSTVPGVEVWIECLRILKPGGHLLAFAGTRTQHRMACAIEDAGFEIRDMIAWVYGSGFPKSLAIDKAIDKLDATDARRDRQLKFTEWMRGTGLTQSRIDELTDTNMGGHYLTAASQPAVATRDLFEKLRPHFSCDVPEWVEQMVNERTVESENFKRREVIGNDTKARSTSGKSALPTCGGDTVYESWDITAPATEAARQWSGWGTALKPSLEPITMARKPLIGTVAANVLQYGTGGINVDACRVGVGEQVPGGGGLKGGATSRHEGWQRDSHATGTATEPHTQGRWPANLIHSGCDEVLALFPDAPSCGTYKKSMSRPEIEMNNDVYGKGWTASTREEKNQYAGDSGSAARFFYTPKADSAERRQSKHPTVKPLDLIRYLVRMVTPEGGIVLDPFLGSGTLCEAARAEHCKSIGIELDAAYCSDAVERLRQGVLF